MSFMIFIIYQDHQLDFCNSAWNVQLYKKQMKRILIIKSITTTNSNERAQIDIVNFQSVSDKKFKWILNHQDHTTKFIIILINS